MSPPFEVRLPLEQSYLRQGLFALDLIDAVTLSRISHGIEVIANGLPDKPIVNASGLFVWLKGDLAALRTISIRPGALPYENVEVSADKLRLPPLPRPILTIELPPRVDYVFATGVTGVRGTLIEAHGVLPTPVRNAEIRLRWLDDDGVTWWDAPTTSHTNDDGDFIAILRLAPTDAPRVDVAGAVTVRLQANGRASADLKLPQGHVTDPTTLNPLIFAWEELQP